MTNPQNRNSYRVAIPGQECGQNYCSCRDFAVNTLGTCKHVEFVLHKLRKNRLNRDLLKKGFQPAFSNELRAILGKDKHGPGGRTYSLVEKDAGTSRLFLKIPLPEPKIVENIVSALTPLLQAFRTGKT